MAIASRWRSGRDRFELYARRTFAMSVWEWLKDATVAFSTD
jgi:sarcosine oxidase gamma subunit